VPVIAQDKNRLTCHCDPPKAEKQSQKGADMEYDFNILYYVNVYKKWWRVIVRLVSLAMFFTIVFSFFIPKSYVSTVTLISANSGTVSPIGKLLDVSGFLSGTSSNDVIIAMLKSERMSKDILTFLNINKQAEFKYTISAHPVTAGLMIKVKGGNPLYTKKIANFAVQNLDKINSELNITPEKPMVKVLDSAVSGMQESRKILHKIASVVILTLLSMSIWIFLSEYIKKTKMSFPHDFKE